MDGWILLGESYVQPVDWDQLRLIEPEGVGYAHYVLHTNGKRELIGTAGTPRAASKLQLVS